MKEKIKKQIETFVYGMLSLIFAMAFFFGVLYPDRGLSPQSYRIMEDNDYSSEMVDSEYGSPRWNKNVGEYENEYENAYESDRLSSSKDGSVCGKPQIRCKSYLYERLKNS